MEMDSINESSSPPIITKLSRRFQTFIDKTVPFLLPRWISTLVLYVLYFARVFILQVFYWTIGYSCTLRF